MSSITKAIITKNFTNIECVEDSLNELGITFTKNKSGILLSNGVLLTEDNSIISISYLPDDQHLNFVSDFPKTYEKILDKKIEKMRFEEARLQEEIALDEFSEKDRKAQERYIRLERKKLEEIQRKEAQELQKKIAESVNSIQEKAEKFGFTVKEEIREKERILQLVRRI